MLTARLGDNVAFRDTSEAEFGIANREFKSFRTAAKEAGMSRVYGGIHYINSCLKGTKQGKQVANVILSRLKFKKPAKSAI